ncbi:YncE family protein [Romboutsia weinsteinii]|uniref:YncE family protein n=1 Tax=Romboutsia weinsteinii TaxID=2020949 RepID=A0A371J1V7_9FIRM|nr:YncE family protein [Romboutsia weinsteinii]RDY26695.1 YncE family protein [Romboutsia weinsteinii]
MNKNELLATKINMPIEHIEEVAIAENEDNKIADSYETIIRSRNQINIKNQVSQYQSADKIEKKDDNYKEIYYRYGNYSSKMQILAYVANIDSISVVDILSGKEVIRIPLDVIPLDVVVSPDKKYVYTTYPDDAAIGVISIECNEEIARINLNKPPFTSQVPLAVAVSPNGRFIYVTNFDSQNVSIVEYKNHMWKVIGEIPLTSNAERIAINPDGRLAYVTLPIINEIVVIDLLSNLPISTMSSGELPISVAISKNYVGISANPRSDDITIFNSKLAIASPVNIPVGDRPPGVAFNSKGNLAYVTNRNGNSVSVVNVFLHKVVATIPVGVGPIGVVVTEDNRFTVVANSEDATISIIDNTIKRVVNTVAVGLEPFFLDTITVDRCIK